MKRKLSQITAISLTHEKEEQNKQQPQRLGGLKWKQHNDDADKDDLDKKNGKKQIQDPTVFPNILSQTLHNDNYATIKDEIPAEPADRSAGVEGSTSCHRAYKDEISVDSLLQCLGLKESWEMLLLKKIVDTNALRNFQEEDIKALDIPTGHKEKLLSALRKPHSITTK